MRLQKQLAATLIALVIAVPTIAGEKCDSDATACLKYIIETLEGKGWLGVELNYPEGESPEIIRVVPESPAEAAGLRQGDFLVALNGLPYASATEEALAEAKKALVPGNRVTITIRRDGTDQDLEVVAGKVPQSVLAQWIGNHMLYQHRHQIADADPD